MYKTDSALMVHPGFYFKCDLRFLAQSLSFPPSQILVSKEADKRLKNYLPSSKISLWYFLPAKPFPGNSPSMPELNSPDRLDAFDAELISTTPDDVLQSCVQQASASADTPIALVSLVMRRVQFFRAQIGLPPDLEQSRATSRQSSFCQFVVQGEQPFIVSDAPTDERVPKELVQVYGIGSYLGIPLHYQGEVIGSLCVIDVKPRQFDPLLIDTLKALAGRVVARLATLKEEHAKEEDIPASTDVRSAIIHLSRDIRILDRALVELDSVLRDAEQTSPHELLHSDTQEWKAHLTTVIALSMDLSASANMVEQGARRLLRMLDQANTPVLPAVRALIERSGRSLLRSMAEAYTLPRLLEGLMQGELSVDLLERNASVLKEALMFDIDLRSGLNELMEGTKAICKQLGLEQELMPYLRPLSGPSAHEEGIP